MFELEIEEIEGNIADLESISFMEPPAPEFKSSPTWASIAVANSWTSYPVVPQPTEDGIYFKARFLDQMGRS